MSGRTLTEVLTAAGGAALVGAGAGAISTGLAFAVALGPFSVFFALLVAFVGFLIGIPLAMLHAIVLGLPLYLVVRRWWGQPGRLGSALFGLAIGTLPLATTIALSPGHADGVFLVQQSGQILAVFGLAGALAGLAFRRMLGDEREADRA